MEGRRLILVLPLLALWANVHGSVLMGAGLAAAYLAYRAVTLARRSLWRPACACSALSVAALLMTLVTPYGVQIVHYYIELLGNRAIAAVLIADSAGTWLPTEAPSRGFGATLAAAAVGLAAVGVGMLAIRSPDQYERLTPSHAIAVAAAYATQHPCIRILADNDAASALLWHDPSLAGRVAFDARLEQYPEPSLDRWITFQTADTAQWLSATRGYQLLIGSTIYNPTLVHRLAQLPASTVLARDARGIAVRAGTVSRCGA